MRYKAGYQGKDAMREKAEKAMGKISDTSMKTVMPSSAVGKEKMRPYKAGGAVKMAAGGVGKIRHGQATAKGKPKK